MADHQFFGLLSAGLAIAIELRYLFSILRKKTVPSLFGWTVIVVSMMLIFFSSYQLGARDSLYLVGTLVLFHTMSAILAIKYGHRKISRFDVLCLTTAFMGTALWIVTKDPITALVLNVAVDFAGMSIICWKLYQLPGSEDRIAWGGSSIFYGINLLAVSSWNVGQFLFPISNFVTCTTIFLLTFRKENHLQMPRSSL